MQPLRATLGRLRQGWRSLFIQVESTPNPSSLKFVPGRQLLQGSSTANFVSFRAAQASPLARALFKHPDVKNVLIAGDFVAVTISDASRWPLLKPDIFASMEDFFASGQPVVREDSASEDPNQGTLISEDDSDTVALIKELIETRIRPYVQEDGGDIVYHGFRDGYVMVQLQGSCVGCPSSSLTLKSGIESMLKHYCPEIKGVNEFVDDDVEKASQEQLSKLENPNKG